MAFPLFIFIFIIKKTVRIFFFLGIYLFWKKKKKKRFRGPVSSRRLFYIFLFSPHYTALTHFPFFLFFGGVNRPMVWDALLKNMGGFFKKARWLHQPGWPVYYPDCSAANGLAQVKPPPYSLLGWVVGGGILHCVSVLTLWAIEAH